MPSTSDKFLLALALALPVSAGCAAIKATQQPGKKDLGVLSTGTQRTHVIAELGAPIWSSERDSDTIDLFAFKQGYTKGTKAGRALVHGAADVATFGLWEVVGIPAEMLADGTEVHVEVHYDERQVVRTVEVLKGDKAFQPSKYAAWRERRKAAKEAPVQDATINDENVVVADDPIRR